MALETEDLPRALGATTVDAVSTVAAAREVVARGDTGFAMLDIHVGGETGFAFAASCAELGIPFVFASRYGDGTELGETHRTAPIVRKPHRREDVGTAVSTTLLSHQVAGRGGAWNP